MTQFAVQARKFNARTAAELEVRAAAETNPARRERLLQAAAWYRGATI